MKKFSALALLAFTPTLALAQEAMYTAAATMPSPGTFIDRPMFHYWRFGDNPVSGEGSTDRFEFSNKLSYGIVRDLAASLDISGDADVAEDPSGASHTDLGIDVVELELKYRFYKSDSGGIDTVRAAIIGGANLRVDGEFSVNPRLGAVLTIVSGRHGFNQDVMFTLNTDGSREDNFGNDGPDDTFHHSTSYVYRFWPEQFGRDSRGAWYTTLELTGMYETGGDYDLRLGPGVMYEGYRWAFEAMGQFPIYQDVEDRPELRFGVGMGLRFSF